MSLWDQRDCGAQAVGGRCVLPAGHNIGRVDIPENHSAALCAAGKADPLLEAARRLAFTQPDGTVPGAWDLEDLAYVRYSDLEALRAALEDRDD